MSHVFLDTRDGGLRLYLNGDLQFDSRDERLYHEPLALVPTALAVRRSPRRALRVLILGGGDGLALREVLRVPEVAEAHVVDRDPEVLRLGAGALAALNHGAFRDGRARVHVRDAREVLGRARDFDVVIYDLTYPGDLAGAALLSVPVIRKARAALRPGGILAVNAVSPELTPKAFGCVGATLGAAGLRAIAYAFALPSFREEGYGRWGFFYASSRPIGRDELRRLRLPEGASLTAGAVLGGTRFPAAAAAAMRAAPNRSDELLYYLFNATPLAWEGPWRPLRFAPTVAAPGPRLTAAHGFARWLGEPEGRRSLEELVGCLPLSQRGQTREALLDWSHQAEVLFREVDLRAFLDRALRRAAGLPRAWVRELRALRDRIRDGLPSMRELLEHAYRVFAIYLLVLLLANLFFPDNLYAKGWSSSSASRSGWSVDTGATSAPFHGFSFTDPTARPAPYRFRPAGPVFVPGVPRGRVYDRQGREYPAQHVALVDPGGGRRPVSALLALSPELQLLESGTVVYAASLAGYQVLLEPGRLRVLDVGGCEVTALLPPRPLQADARRHIESQIPLIDKALADHRRWLDWVGWASVVPQGRAPASELGELEAIKRAAETAQARWGGPVAGPAFEPAPRWVSIFPGIYLEPPALPQGEPAAVLVRPDGQAARRPLAPPPALTAEDRFLFRILERRLGAGHDPSLAGPVARWMKAHGEALGVTRPPSPPGPCT
ncbi:MAG: hypothetical protein HY002_08180 [Candidatus Rokubacteria bacterium]|nr:hypothetical protein [Candidatus Rokubacteria bacterium]